MYQHGALSGRERRLANIAMLTDPMCVPVSSYVRRIDAQPKVFRPDPLRVLTMDDLRDRPEATLRALSAHIGVVWYPPLLSKNPGRTSAKDEGRTPPPLLRSETLTLFGRLVRRTPKRVTDVGKRIVTRKASIDAPLSPQTVAELRQRLRPDTERLRG